MAQFINGTHKAEQLPSYIKSVMCCLSPSIFQHSDRIVVTPTFADVPEKNTHLKFLCDE